MPTFDTSGKGVRTPFRNNEYLRSTVGVKTESYTFAHTSMPTEDIDGSDEKVLQAGTVIARITSGPQEGKVGVFQAGATDGRQTAANILGLCDTFAPWQLNHRDIEVAVVYDASVVQDWCYEYNADGERVTLTNATRDAIVANVNTRLIRFS